MTREATFKAAMQLSQDERIELAMDLWDAITPQVEQLALTEAQERELDRRIAAHDGDPAAAIPWETVRGELREELEKLRKGS